MLEYQMFRMYIISYYLCVLLTVYFRQTQESANYIDSTLPNAYVYDFEKSQFAAFPICTAICKTLII